MGDPRRYLDSPKVLFLSDNEGKDAIRNGELYFAIRREIAGKKFNWDSMFSVKLIRVRQVCNPRDVAMTPLSTRGDRRIRRHLTLRWRRRGTDPG